MPRCAKTHIPGLNAEFKPGKIRLTAASTSNLFVSENSQNANGYFGPISEAGFARALPQMQMHK
jgi:hypothetical protein